MILWESLIQLSKRLADKDKEKEKKIENKNNDKKSITEVIVPSLGESITEAVIGKWIKSVGQEVAKGEPLVEIETDKVTQELYAEDNGVIKEFLYQGVRRSKNRRSNSKNRVKISYRKFNKSCFF